MQVGKGLKDDKVSKMLQATTGFIPGEDVWVAVKCINFRPNVDHLIVTNMRVIGLSSAAKTIKYDIAFDRIHSVDYNPPGRAISIVGDDNSDMTFKNVDSSDVGLVQHYIDSTRSSGTREPDNAALPVPVSKPVPEAPAPKANPFMDLPDKAQRKLLPALSDGEDVIVVAEGEHGAIVGTDQRIMIVKWGITTGSFFSSQVNSWSLTQITGIELRKGMTTSSVVIQAAGTSPVTLFNRFDKGPNSVWEAPNAIFFQTNQNPDMLVNRLRQLVASSQTPAGSMSPPAVPAGPDIATQIRSLAQLRDEGLLTDDEFETKKRSLLGL